METTITFFDGAVQPGRRITMSAVTRSGVCQLGAWHQNSWKQAAR